MKYLIIFFIIIFYLTSTNGEQIGGDTGLKLPRYVSLKSNDANLRIGSSTNYPIKIKYVIKNLPVEIIDENKNWRKIIDFEKNTGWMHKSLLKGNRYAIIDTPYQEGSQILHKPKGNVIGKIGNRNVVRVLKCLNKWCYINYDKHSGWIIKSNLWGVYNNETFNIPFYQKIINLIWKINI